MLKGRSIAIHKDQGFALVVSLSILPLLGILALGLLAISSVELRRSGQQQARLEAQANARLALMMAMGELQKHLGPDQRVSADSRLFKTSDSLEIDQPHWLNVWRTTRPDGSPMIVRTADEGGLRDFRENGDWDPAAERTACLVSGNEMAIIYRQGPGAMVPEADGMIKLVGAGSVGPDAETEMVSAPLVDLSAPDGSRGSYSWWVGDLGVRANLSIRDPHADSMDEPVRLRSVLLSQDASAAAIEGAADLANDERTRLVSPGQFPLATADRDAVRRHFHDFTSDSMGLLVDVREGGLKKDLTAYLAGGGFVPDLKADGKVRLGLRDGDRLVGPRNALADSLSPAPGQAARFSEVSPRFGLLRDWARRALTAPFGNHQAMADYAARAGDRTDSRNRSPTEFRNRVKTDLTPVLVEGSIYYNLSYYDAPGADAANPYGMRLHLYPRVALWNPYNFDLRVHPSMIFLHINGMKWIEVGLTSSEMRRYRMYWGLGGGSSGGGTQGSLFFKLDGATLKPGETVVWSPSGNRRYDESTFSNNLLTPGAVPSPRRSFYQDSRVDGHPLFKIQQASPVRAGYVDGRLPAVPREWREFVPPRPPGNVQSSRYTQADNYLMSWKPLDGAGGSVDLSAFDRLPQGRFISCAYQYGDEDELPVEWSEVDPVPFPRSTMADPSVAMTPDRRTRDGFRLRWAEEHESNRLGGGSLAGTPFLESSAIANWNLRASYAFRNPFDNVTDVAPNYFGIYTRDLFDGAVDWDEMSPRFDQGMAKGDPFDQAARFPWPRILFDIPRRRVEIASLGAFQHVSFSEFIWHPTYALGNSLADPRIELTGTEPRRSDPLNSEKGGWNENTIGYALDGRSNPNNNTATTREDNWAYLARGLLQHVAVDQTLIYDLSYELNHAMWDEFFLSTGSAAEKSAFLADPEGSPLPNGRVRFFPGLEKPAGVHLLDFHRAASKLAVDGAFNVNSTSAAAWEAMLLASAGGGYGENAVVFPRIAAAAGDVWDGTDARGNDAWCGQRTFSRGEIRRLAEEIVVEVKLRGPFLSMADFVNRRLRADETGKKGALQAAIDRAGLNGAFEAEWPLDNEKALPKYKHPDHIVDPTRLEQRHKPDTTAWGALGFLTQADLLQFLGPALTARSDTFVIRAYGSSVGPDGKVRAEAWCEAVAQRSPEPLVPDELGLDPKVEGQGAEFGRRFRIVRFRWLGRDEI